MHFHGLVITDALDMGGVTKGFPPGEVAVRALVAGADVLLMSPVTDAALASVRDAVASGRVPMARVDDAVRRVLEAKARLGLDQKREVDIDKLSTVFRRPEFLATAEDIADRGVTLLRNDAGLVPLDPRTTKRVFLLAVSADPDTIPAEPFERELRAQLDTVESLHVDTKYFRVAETHLPSPDSYDLAICALTVRVADHKNAVGLPAEEMEMVHALLRAGKPVIMVGLGSPYLSEGFPGAKTWVAAFSVQDVAERAAARAVLGTFAVSGKLPVSLPGAAPHALRVGDGMTTAAIPLTLQPASAELEARLKPAFELLKVHGILAVGYRGEEAIGRGEPFPVGPTPPANNPVVLTPDFSRIYRQLPIRRTAIARLIQLKQLTMDTPLATILQGTQLAPAGGWRGITLRQLLEGTSGLELTRRPANDTGKIQDILSFAADEQTRHAAGEAEREIEPLIVSTLTGLKFETAVDQLLFEPLGVSLAPPGGQQAVPPAEGRWDAEVRALAVVGQLWLNGGIYGHKRLLSRQVVEQFTAHKRDRGVIFTPGWEVSTAPGRFFSATSYGWSEGTWGSLWVDPERELFVVLLTEGPRMWDESRPRAASPGRGRGELYDAIFAALGLSQAK